MIDLVTVADVIEAGGSIHGRCETCDRVKTFDPAKAKMPSTYTLSHVQQAMRCSGCNEKTIVLRVIPRPPTHDEIMAHPSVKAVLDAFPGSTVTTKSKGHTDEE